MRRPNGARLTPSDIGGGEACYRTVPDKGLTPTGLPGSELHVLGDDLYYPRLSIDAPSGIILVDDPRTAARTYDRPEYPQWRVLQQYRAARLADISTFSPAQLDALTETAVRDEYLIPAPMLQVDAVLPWLDTSVRAIWLTREDSQPWTRSLDEDDAEIAVSHVSDYVAGPRLLEPYERAGRPPVAHRRPPLTLLEELAWVRILEKDSAWDGVWWGEVNSSIHLSYGRGVLFEPASFDFEFERFESPGVSDLLTSPRNALSSCAQYVGGDPTRRPE